MFRFLKTIPFTLVLLAAVVTVAALTQTHVDGLDPLLRRLTGFAPVHLARWQWQRIFTSVIITGGGLQFYTSLLMLAACVGTAERIYGTWRALAAFFAIHLGTLLCESLLLAFPLHYFEFTLGKLLVRARDVGPSAGYYGCLGLACMALPRQRRAIVLGGIAALLAARLVWTLSFSPHAGPSVAGDVAHPIALLLGMAMSFVVTKRIVHEHPAEALTRPAERQQSVDER